MSSDAVKTMPERGFGSESVKAVATAGPTESEIAALAYRDVQRSPAAILARSSKRLPSSLPKDGGGIGKYGNVNASAPDGSGVLPARRHRRESSRTRKRIYL